MTVKFHFKPSPEVNLKSFLSVQGQTLRVAILYQMFPELVEEFGTEKYPRDMDIPLEDISHGLYEEFAGKVILPYGEILKPKVVAEEANGEKSKPLNEKEVVTHKCNPVPIS